MRTPKSGRAIGCVLLAALLSSIGAHAAVTDIKKPVQVQPASAVADIQASARRQGAVNIGGINWACSGAHCSTSIMPSVAAAPLVMCQGLAREVGAIRSFVLANRPLNGKELQQCNSVIPAVAAAMPGMKTPQGAGLPPAAPVPGVVLPPMQALPRLNNAPVIGFAPPQAPALPTIKPVTPAAPLVAMPELKPPPSASMPAAKPEIKPKTATTPTGLRTITAGSGIVMTGVAEAPRIITVGAIAMTGLAEITRTVNSGSITMTGLAEATRTITTGLIAMTGLAEVTRTITTGLIAMTGLAKATRTVNAGDIVMTGLGQATRTISVPGGIQMTGLRP